MNPVIDQKNELLLYAAQVRPLAVIVLIFDKVSLKDINPAMASLFKAALPKCDSSRDRGRLRSFQKWQRILFQALLTIYHDKNLPANTPNKELTKLQTAYKRHVAGKRVSRVILQDPTLILRQLLKTCPASYAQIRLW